MALDEFALIGRHFAPLATAPGALRLTDDAGLIGEVAGCELAVTTDTMVAGVHFLADDPADSLGHKILAVNLSDLAAMGAEPLYYLLALAIPRQWSEAVTEAWLSGFARGLAATQERFRVFLLGGDTVATPDALVLTLTAIGRVPAGQALRRSAARAGDLVFVSGTIGDGTLGLKVLTAAQAPPAADAARLIERYRRPTPRLALGCRLVGLAHAAADVSDGLVADLGHICRASGVTATLALEHLPLSAEAKAMTGGDVDALVALMTGGDDYELVFTAAREQAAAIADAGEGVGVTIIGRIDDAAAGKTPPADDELLVKVEFMGRPVAIGRTGYRHLSTPPRIRRLEG